MKVAFETCKDALDVTDFINGLREDAKRPINEIVLSVTYNAAKGYYVVFYLTEE